ARIKKPDGIEHFVASPFDLGIAKTEVARPERDFIPDRGGGNLMVGVLKDIGCFARRFGRAKCGAVTPVEDHAAFRGFQQSNDMFRKRGLAGSVLSNDRKKLAALDSKIDS